MKTVKIPTHMNPFVVVLNGEEHTFEAGSTVEVSDSLAEVIENSEFAPPVAPIIPNGISSWNDLADKPFGDYGEKTIIIVPETTVVTEDLDGLVCASLEFADIIEGETYKVVLNGTEHNLTAYRSSESTIILGDPFSEYGQYSFSILHEVYEEDEEYWLTLYTEHAGTYTISIAKVEREIVPIDEKYLVLTSPDGSKWNIIVNNNGDIYGRKIGTGEEPK